MILIYNASKSAKILNEMSSLKVVTKNMVYSNNGDLTQALKIVGYLIKQGCTVAIEKQPKQIFISVKYR